MRGSNASTHLMKLYNSDVLHMAITDISHCTTSSLALCVRPLLARSAFGTATPALVIETHTKPISGSWDRPSRMLEARGCDVRGG
jgi:hypothetical protein